MAIVVFLRVGVWALLIVLLVLLFMILYRQNKIPFLQNEGFEGYPYVLPQSGLYSSTRGYGYSMTTEVPSDVIIVHEKGTKNRWWYYWTVEPKGSIHEMKWRGTNGWEDQWGRRAFTKKDAVYFADGTVWSLKKS